MQKPVVSLSESGGEEDGGTILKGHAAIPKEHADDEL